MYDYVLGGKHNSPVDPEAAERLRERAPDVVYVDLDPMVRAYACELLAHDGTTAAITADMRQPDTVLNDPGLRRLIDLDEPVGLLMTTVLHFVADDNDPWGLVARYMGALAPGSYLALSHATGVWGAEAPAAADSDGSHWWYGAVARRP
jgi:S-adenosyl methyltransferase